MLSRLKKKYFDFLRLGTEYFGLDLKYFISGGFWLTLGQIFSTAIAFLLAIFFAKFLPKETYGIYSFVLSAAGILAIANLPGIGDAITQAVARNYEGSLLPALKMRIRWGLLGSAAGLAAAAYYYFNGNITFAVSFFIVSLFLPLMDSFNLYDAFLSGKKLFNISVKYNIAGQIFSAGILIAAIFLTKDIFWILLAYFAPLMLANFIFFQITLKKYAPNRQEDPNTISYGKHLSAMRIIGTIANYLDGILVFHYLGAASLAIYAFAIAPPEQLKGLLKNLNILILPKFSQRTREELKTAMRHQVFKLSAIIAPIVILYILAAPYIYEIFFPRYLDAVFYSQLFAASLIFGVNIIPFTILQSQMAQKELYWYNTIGSIAQIALLFILIYLFGLLGAVSARILTRFIFTATAFWFVRKT